MSRRHLLMLAVLSAIWGASFMFIKVAVRELEPATLIFFRVALGASALAPLAARYRADLARHRRDFLVGGALNAAVPFWLLSGSETKIDSGLAAILQASAPIFTAALAFAFVGVALLVGAQPRGDILAAFAVVGTAFCYAAAILYAGRRLGDLHPIAVAF